MLFSIKTFSWGTDIFLTSNEIYKTWFGTIHVMMPVFQQYVTAAHIPSVRATWLLKQPHSIKNGYDTICSSTLHLWCKSQYFAINYLNYLISIQQKGIKNCLSALWQPEFGKSCEITTLKGIRFRPVRPRLHTQTSLRLFYLQCLDGSGFTATFASNNFSSICFDFRAFLVIRVQTLNPLLSWHLTETDQPRMCGKN